METIKHITNSSSAPKDSQLLAVDMRDYNYYTTDAKPLHNICGRWMLLPLLVKEDVATVVVVYSAGCSVYVVGYSSRGALHVIRVKNLRNCWLNVVGLHISPEKTA